MNFVITPTSCFLFGLFFPVVWTSVGIGTSLVTYAVTTVSTICPNLHMPEAALASLAISLPFLLFALLGFKAKSSTRLVSSYIGALLIGVPSFYMSEAILKNVEGLYSSIAGGLTSYILTSDERGYFDAIKSIGRNPRIKASISTTTQKPGHLKA